MLSGYKTYITGGLGLLVGIAALFGFAPTGLVADPATLIEASLAAMFLRAGVNTAVATGGK